MPKVITRDHIENLISDRGLLWSITDHKRYDSKKRFEYLCRCKCGKFKWIKWAKLQKGESTGCRSCAKLNRGVHSRRSHPLKQAWYDITKRSKKLNGCGFRGYAHFRDWSLSGGWRHRARLRRIDSRRIFGPNNCYWDHGVFIDAKSTTYKLIAKDLGVTTPAIRYWLKKGLTLKQVILRFKEKM